MAEELMQLIMNIPLNIALHAVSIMLQQQSMNEWK
jgi:hypothetical protein